MIHIPIKQIKLGIQNIANIKFIKAGIKGLKEENEKLNNKNKEIAAQQNAIKVIDKMEDQFKQIKSTLILL